MGGEYNASIAYTEKIVSAMSSPLFIKITVAIITLLLGLTLARVLARIAGKLLREIEINAAFKAVSGIDYNLASLAETFTFYLITFFTIISVLNELGIATTVLQLIGATAVLLLVISFALAVKDFIPNSIAGIVIYRKGFVKKGERIRVKDLEGTVESVTLNETHLTTDGGDLITIPNASLLKTEVVKIKYKQRKKRV